MAKRAPIDVIRAGTVHPGKYLVLVGGAVADVEEALEAGREVGASSVLDVVLIPNVHPELVAGIRGERRAAAGEALGIIETATVAAILEAADAGLKGARVQLLEIRLADDLGGKGYLLFDGAVADVEAAVEIGAGRIAGSPGLAHRVHRAAPRRDGGEPGRRCALRRADPGVAAVQLARVIGTVVATVKAPGLEGVKLLVIQPLDRHLRPWAARSSPRTRSTWPAPASSSTSSPRARPPRRCPTASSRSTTRSWGSWTRFGRSPATSACGSRRRPTPPEAKTRPPKKARPGAEGAVRRRRP